MSIPKNANAPRTRGDAQRQYHEVTADVGAAPAGNRMLVTLTAHELRALVAGLLAELEPHEPAPALLTAQQLCAAVQISRATLHRLQLRGLPRVMLLDSPRYRLEAVLAWLEHRGTAQALIGGGP